MQSEANPGSSSLTQDLGLWLAQIWPVVAAAHLVESSWHGCGFNCLPLGILLLIYAEGELCVSAAASGLAEAASAASGPLKS